MTPPYEIVLLQTIIYPIILLPGESAVKVDNGCKRS